MPGTSPILGLPLANQTTDFVTDFPNAVDIPRTTNLEKYTVMRFATVAARDAKIPTPVDGMVCYLQDTGTLQQHNGFVWVGDTAPLTPVGQSGFSITAGTVYWMDHRGVCRIRGGAICTSNTNFTVCTIQGRYAPAMDLTSAQYIKTTGGYTAGPLTLTGSSFRGWDMVGAGFGTVREIGLNFMWQVDFKAVR